MDDTRPLRFEWNPVAWALLRVVTAVVAVWALVVGGLTIWRELRVDTWAGPDAAVTSGQRLEGCEAHLTFRDPIFPAWIRFEGDVFVGADQIRPVGDAPYEGYTVTGYTLGQLELLRDGRTPAGQAGDQIVMKLVGVGVGEMYVREPDC